MVEEMLAGANPGGQGAIEYGMWRQEIESSHGAVADFRRHDADLTMRSLYPIFGVFGILLVAASPTVTAPATERPQDRPFLAIWRDTEGFRRSEAPYLRVAIWNDGRIIFAKDPKKWGHELLEGGIDAARVAELKKALEGTGVFELKGNSYLVPDGPVDCVMLDLGAKQQMLYWDEVETANYGINISPKAHHLKFKSCWKEVNNLALGAIPKQSQSHAGRFPRPPSSWRLKRPIQSE